MAVQIECHLVGLPSIVMRLIQSSFFRGRGLLCLVMSSCNNSSFLSPI